jgi:hypothetical protein
MNVTRPNDLFEPIEPTSDDYNRGDDLGGEAYYNIGT